MNTNLNDPDTHDADKIGLSGEQYVLLFLQEAIQRCLLPVFLIRIMPSGVESFNAFLANRLTSIFAASGFPFFFGFLNSASSKTSMPSSLSLLTSTAFLSCSVALIRLLCRRCVLTGSS